MPAPNAIDLLLSLGESPKAECVQESISVLCETWYLQERDSRDAVVAHTLSYLLKKTLEPTAKITYLKRLNKIRSSLELLDFEDPITAPGIREILQGTTVNPFFLVNEPGKKFIIYLFSLHEDLIDDLHAAILSSLPTSKDWMAEAYAEIYFKVSPTSPLFIIKAWRASEGQSRLRIEHNCIQDYIKHAIHLKNQRLLKSTQIILNYFQTQKLQFRHIDAMLVRLYEPILWRSLTVANPLVRRNAVSQFTMAFPLVKSCHKYVLTFADE